MSDASPAVPPLAQLTHTVVSGDTLSAIAQKHGVTLADLLKWNAISDPNRINVGDVIHIMDPNADIEYTVVKGDTVSGLAERFGKTWLDIAAVNKLEDMNLIYVGQKLIIPAQGVARGR